MIRGFAAVCAASLLLFTASCKTAPAGVSLPRIEPGANPAGEMVRVRGTLVRSGACLAVPGSGTTVIVWPRSAPAPRSGGNGTIVIVWPLQAVAEAPGPGTVVVVWPFGRAHPPIRTGETVELNGIITIDDIAGFARLPDDPGCRGSHFLVVRQGQATPASVPVPQLKAGASPVGEATRLKGRLMRSGACLAVQGNGNTIVVWPRSAQARVDGNGNVVVIWPFRRTDPPLRTGEEVELNGIIITEDNLSGFTHLPDDPGCRTGRYLVVREVRPAG